MRNCAKCKKLFNLWLEYKHDPALLHSLLNLEEMNKYPLPVYCMKCVNPIKEIKQECGRCGEVTKIPVEVFDKHLGDRKKIEAELGTRHAPGCQV